MIRPTHRLQRARLAWIVLAIAITCCACGGGTESGTPAATVEQFYDHLNSGSYDAARGLYNAEVLGVLQDETDDSFRTWADTLTRNGIVSKVEILSSELNDEKTAADIEFEVVFDDGTKQRSTVTVTQEEGQWRMGFII